MVPVPDMVVVEEVGCQAYVVEEVGCQARMKRRVVRPMSSFLWVRNYWELFPCALGNSYRALRLLVDLLLKPSEGKWGSRRTVEQRRGTLPRVGQTCGE
jgi:hypothetical protein